VIPAAVMMTKYKNGSAHLQAQV